MVHTTRTRRSVTLLLLCLTVLIFWSSSHSSHRLSLPSFHAASEEPPTPINLSCRSLQGANDTVVILRTGSTELEDRLTAHLSTSLRCFPKYLIFSDLEEKYLGEHIRDALSSVQDDIRNNHPDFELYRRLQKHGRAALESSELSGPPEAFEHNDGITQNPGWKLDKWKFMPMVDRTFQEHPDARWYIFIEADTFLLWSMLLQYLSLLDHTQPFYAGCGTCLGKNLFGHGGSGFVVSRPAMHLAVQHYSAHKAAIEDFTNKNWAGDYVLGKVFDNAGVSFTDAWPHFQGDYPGLVAYAGPDGRYAPAASTREWCMPTISYHHMSGSMVSGLWDFEQQWINAHANGSTADGELRLTETLTHEDVFKEYVMPQMMGPKADWDNLSDEDEGEASDVHDCRARCEARPECRQYSFARESQRCRTRADPRLGKQGDGLQSGWMEDRVRNFALTAPPCGNEGWQVGAATRSTRCG